MSLLWNILLFLVGCSIYVAVAIWLVHKNKEKSHTPEFQETAEANRQTANVDAIESTLRAVSSSRRNRAANMDREMRPVSSADEHRLFVTTERDRYDGTQETVSSGSTSQRSRINSLV